MSEAQDIFPNEDCDCILSIGTGLGNVITIEDTRLSILEALKKMASNSDAVHHRLAGNHPEGVYFRFNVVRGLDDVALSDWNKSSRISAHTSNYLEDVHVKRAINRCVFILAQG